MPGATSATDCRRSTAASLSSGSRLAFYHSSTTRLSSASDHHSSATCLRCLSTTCLCLSSARANELLRPHARRSLRPSR
ncbi:Os05g0437001 [Oryza sativa Japonica Group]|uniref:Os05g0437001 protein n=1 Tax=Oryza sativa subsp. japonica TaxID=39947 RepID=A0A0P0WMR4_ORYSJ|nr:Os05g0437001 [Oryza sativa Japonica Group]